MKKKVSGWVHMHNDLSLMAVLSLSLFEEGDFWVVVEGGGGGGKDYYFKYSRLY